MATRRLQVAELPVAHRQLSRAPPAQPGPDLVKGQGRDLLIAFAAIEARLGIDVAVR